MISNEVKVISNEVKVLLEFVLLLSLLQSQFSETRYENRWPSGRFGGLAFISSRAKSTFSFHRELENVFHFSLANKDRWFSYSSSKFAAVGFHRALTSELEALGKTGIKTSCLCPVFVNTGFTKNPSTRWGQDQVRIEI